MEPVVHDALSFYQRSLKEGDNSGLRYLENMGLMDIDLIEKTGLGWCSGKMAAILGKHQKNSLMRLGLMNRLGEHFRNCLVLPVHDKKGILVDLYGLRLRSTDIRPVMWKEPFKGVINGQCLDEYREIIFCEYPLYWLQCMKEGFRNCIAARNEAEAVTLCRELKNCGATKVHYIGRKYRKSLSTLLDGDGIEFQPMTMTSQGTGISGEELRKLSLPKAKEEISLTRETETHLYFRAGSVDYRVEREVIITPSKKAQLKCVRENSQFLDRVDFTTSKSRSRFAKLASVRLQLPPNVIEEQMADMADALDRMYMERVDCHEDEPELSKADEREALNILQNKNMLEWFSAILEKSLGYAGSEPDKRLAILVTASRLLDEPAGAVVRGAAGCGKSTLLSCAAKLLPQNQILVFSRLTPQALYFLPREKLLNKLLVVDEYEGIQQSEYALRTLMSSQMLSVASTVKDGGSMPVTKTVSIPARLAVLVSTTHPMNPENLSRFIEIRLSASKAQNIRVMEAMARGVTNPEFVQVARNVNSLLQACRVDVPFGRLLMNGGGVNFSRRKFGQILALIKAHAALHQYQREYIGENIQATLDDYRAVYELLPSMTEHTEEDLTPNGMALLRHINGNSLTAFTREDIMTSLNWSYSRAYRTLRELSGMELIKADQEKNGVKRLYRVNELWKMGSLLENVLNPEEIKQAIRTAFNGTEEKQTA